MESLDNIIEEINKFDISIVNIDNVNQIFKKLDSIISICEDKILSCANKIDNEDSNVIVEVNNEVDDKLNEIMELTKETKKEDEVIPKKQLENKHQKLQKQNQNQKQKQNLMVLEHQQEGNRKKKKLNKKKA